MKVEKYQRRELIFSFIHNDYQLYHVLRSRDLVASLYAADIETWLRARMTEDNELDESAVTALGDRFANRTELALRIRGAIATLNPEYGLRMPRARCRPRPDTDVGEASRTSR